MGDELQANPSLTYGEQMVGLTFNPSGDEKVAKIKRLYAEIIDILYNEGYRTPMHQDIVEAAKLDALRGQMMAVKAVTFDK